MWPVVTHGQCLGCLRINSECDAPHPAFRTWESYVREKVLQRSRGALQPGPPGSQGRRPALRDFTLAASGAPDVVGSAGSRCAALTRPPTPCGGGAPGGHVLIMKVCAVCWDGAWGGGQALLSGRQGMALQGGAGREGAWREFGWAQE